MNRSISLEAVKFIRTHAKTRGKKFELLELRGRL